jgi:hypothetical protein
MPLVLLCYKLLDGLENLAKFILGKRNRGVRPLQAQSAEEIYRLLRTAISAKRSIAAVYHGGPRWLCPHRLGRNREGQGRVLCYQYSGESESGLKPVGSQQTGAAWRWINSARWSCSKTLGRQRPITHALRPA